MLESQQAQLVSGLQELYKRIQNGQGWIDTPLKENTHGQPSTHDILERLGALKQEGHASNDSFEEDLSILQQKLIANGAGFMQRAPSHDSHSDSSAPSPVCEPVSQRPNFSNPFSLNQLPPTLPNQSPYPQNARTVPSTKSQVYPHATINQSNLSWHTPISEFDDSMDFANQFDSPMMDSTLDLSSFPPNMIQHQMVPTAIYPCLTMKDWAGQEDFNGTSTR
jgi:hypothetical protein